MTPTFARLFDRDALLLEARRLGAVKRDRMLHDVRVVDASVVTLPARAVAHFPSTDSRHGGFKITATLSVLEDVLVSAHHPTITYLFAHLRGECLAMCS